VVVCRCCCVLLVGGLLFVGVCCLFVGLFVVYSVCFYWCVCNSVASN